MRRIGLIGGVSWEASKEYYRLINEEVRKRLGGSHSADCIMYSFDFDEVERLQHSGSWDALTERMVIEAKNLEKAGAECLIICANTMHKMVPAIEASTNLDVIHIALATGKQVVDSGKKKVGLLGTKYTMEGDFYKKVIEDAYDIEVMIPVEVERDLIHNVIYDELVQGILSEDSKTKYIEIINRMIQDGMEGVILGCTEIPLLIKQEDVTVPIYDTLTIHALAAVEAALK